MFLSLITYFIYYFDCDTRTHTNIAALLLCACVQTMRPQSVYSRSRTHSCSTPGPSLGVYTAQGPPAVEVFQFRSNSTSFI